MISSRQVVVAAASLFAALAAMPPSVQADNKPSSGNAATNADNDNDNKRRESKGRRDDDQREKRGSFGKSQGGQNSKGEKPSGFQFDNKRTAPEPKTFGNQPQPKPPVVNESTKNAPPGTFSKTPPNTEKFKAEDKNKRGFQKHFGDKDNNGAKSPPTNTPNTFSKTPPAGDNFKAEDKNKPGFQKHFGDNDKNRGPGDKPVVINPNLPGKPPATGFARTAPKALSAGDARKRFDNLRSSRKEKVEAGGKVVIEEPGKRTMFKQNNRLFIQHDETERLRRVAPNARFQKGAGGSTISIIDRPGNVKIYSETDANGQLLRRYRRGPDGRDVIIIDNRRRRGHGGGRDIATGIGIGLGVAAGAAILNSIVDVPEPRVRIPRDKYIVEYDNASEDDVYDALSAPPIEDFRDRYTLDEIRATARLRDRMRRVDLDDINFEFGSWDVDPSEYHKLERIARAMMRVVRRNPNEVFLIEGYTDAVGSNEDNLSLSDRRAELVAEVLSEQFQVPFENLTTQGYGEEYLKVPTDAAERLNRRVAVRRITPLLARGDGPPPPPGANQRGGDSRDGAYDGNGADGPDNADGPPDDGGDDQGPPGDQGDQGANDNGGQGDGRGYEYRPYSGTNPD